MAFEREFPMTSFANVPYPTEHPGVVRAENAIAALKQAVAGFDSARGAATGLMAAVVSALLVVANQVIDTWSEGHLLAAWMVLWAVGFAALALLSSPTRRMARRTLAALGEWRQQRAQEEAERIMWDMARREPRLMAELQAVLGRDEA